MKTTRYFAVSLLLLNSLSYTFAQTKELTLSIANKWEQAKVNEPIVLNLRDIKTNFVIKSAVVTDGTIEIPSQLDDLNGDRQVDELAFILDVPARSKKEIKVTLSAEKSNKTYPSQVYAEMLLSDKKGNHPQIQSLTIPGESYIYNNLHHHGPAFESELVAYRIYFDQKQTVDIYGKYKKGLEIKETQFYPTKEHLAQGCGDDVLWVGGTCGAGALKGWTDGKATHIEPVAFRTECIRAYGPIRTVVDVIDTEWQYQGKELNMTNRYILYGGHRDAQVDVFFTEPLENETFCTGVINVKDSEHYSDHKGLIGCWGSDWPAGANDTIGRIRETVGLAACIPTEYIVDENINKDNLLYIISAKGKTKFTYHISFTSLKEEFGYKSKEAWFKHMQQWKKELENPCRVTIK